MYATLSLNDSKFKAGLKSASAKLSEFNRAAGKYAAAGSVIAGGAIAAGLGKSVAMASDLSETISKSNVVFGDNASEMQTWAKGAANAFGQSTEQALGAASSIGNMFKAMGMADQESAKMSKTIVELASDLASFNNTPIDDSLVAIGAALRGESEPIRRYGVLLDDATLKAEAFAKGLYDGKGSLTPATRALAAYEVILKQTLTAQGDFQRTADGLANSQRTLQAQWANNAAVIGQSLLPVVQQMAVALRDLETSGATERISATIGDWVSGLTGLLTDKDGWDLFVLNAQLAIAKILQLPGFKQIAMLGEIAGKGGYDPNAPIASGQVIPIIEQEIASVYDRIAKKAEEDAIAKDAERRNQQPSAPSIVAPSMPAIAPAITSTESPQRVVDDYMRRGLSMTTNPGSMQDKVLKVQEAIRDILKNAQIQDKQLVW